MPDIQNVCNEINEANRQDRTKKERSTVDAIKAFIFYYCLDKKLAFYYFSVFIYFIDSIF